MSTLGRSRTSKTATAVEDKPASRGTRRTAPGSRTRGWGAYGSVKRTKSLDERLLHLDDGVERVIKFVDDAPFETYLQHFLSELPKGVKKSFVSSRDVDPEQEDCDICAEGDVPSTYSLLNVIDLGPVVQDGDEVEVKPTLKAWRATPTAADKIERIANARRTSPLNREDLYFAVTSAKNNAGILLVDKIEPVKAEDLKNDTGIEPLTGEQFKKLAAKSFDSKEDVGVKEDSDESIQEALGKLPVSD